MGPETVLADLLASQSSSSSFSPLSIMLAIDFSRVAFIMLSYAPSIPTLSKIFLTDLWFMKKQNGKQEKWSILAHVLGHPGRDPLKARSSAGHLGAWTSSGEMSQNTQESTPTSQVLKPVESMWTRNQSPSMVHVPASYSLPNPFPIGIKEDHTSIPFHSSQVLTLEGQRVRTLSMNMPLMGLPRWC